MPEVTVSDNLYQQLTSTADDDDVEDVIWQLLYQRERSTVTASSRDTGE